MAFKSEKQRRCVMALLNKNMTNQQFKTIVNQGIQQKVISKKQSVRILKSDFDNDNVINSKDCKPLDAKRQGIIHDLIKKKQRFEKMRTKKLEKEQDRLLKKIDVEATTLNKTLKVQKKIQDNKQLKQQLSDLKRQNFQQTKAGKVVVQTRRGLIKLGELTRTGAKIAWKKYKKEYL